MTLELDDVDRAIDPDHADSADDRDVASVMYGVYAPDECSIPPSDVASATDVAGELRDSDPDERLFWLGFLLLIGLPALVLAVARLAAC